MNSEENKYNMFTFWFDVLKSFCTLFYEEYILKIFKSNNQKIRDEDERIKREEILQKEDNEWFSKVTRQR